MSSIEFIVTDAGRAALINAQHNGTNAVTIAQMGVSGTPMVATRATAVLPGEVKRIATISGGAVAADTMHVAVRDESADVFTVRSFAFYLSDGTLFGSYGQAGVIAEKSAQAMLLFATDVIFEDIDAAMLTFGDANFLNPPATTDTAGVVKLATDAEATTMANAIKALTPRGMALAFTAANVLARLLSVDGSGSGLDADLLDGQDGTYYTNITARLGYTPLNALSYTAGDVLAKLLTVDGAGSGLDADLLDGRQAADFALRSADVSFRDVVATRGDGSGVVFLGGAGRYLQYYGASDAYILPGSPLLVDAVIRRAGNGVWDAGNDGAGSGLDADLLDGRQAAEFALLTGAYFTGALTSTVGFRAFPAANPTTAAGATQIQAGEISQNPAYRFSMGYWLNAGQWSGVLNALANNVAAPLNIQPSGGVAIFGGQVVVQTAAAGNDAFATLGNLSAGSGQVCLQFGRAGANNGAATIQAVKEGAGVNTLTLQPSGGALTAGGTFSAAGKVTLLGGTGGDALTLDGGFGGGIVYKDGGGSVYSYAMDGGQTYRLSFSSATVGGAGGLAMTTSSLNFNGFPIWNIGNDGAGSGLDADLLDGRQGAEYALLSGTGLFTGTVVSQANEAFRAAGGSPYISFTNAAASVRWGYIQHTGAGGVLAIVNDQAGQIQFQVGATQPLTLTPGAVGVTGTLAVSGAISRAGGTVWDALNDGSGSGMDADLLDGRHAGDFALLSDATRYGSNGNGFWEKRPNGVIEQWGQVSGPFGEQQVIVTFPIAFTDSSTVQIIAMGHNYTPSDKKDMFVQLVAIEPTGCTLFVQWTAAASSLAQLDGLTWRAIGR